MADRVRVHGTWENPAGLLRPGQWAVYSNAQVSSASEGVVLVPLGLVYTGWFNEDEAAHGGVSIEIMVPPADDPDIFPNGYALSVEVTPSGSETVTYDFTPTADVDLAARLPSEVFDPASPAPLPGVGVAGGLARLDAHGYLDLSLVVTQATNLIVVDATVGARPYVPTGYTLLILNRTNSVKPTWAAVSDLFLFAPRQT